MRRARTVAGAVLVPALALATVLAAGVPAAAAPTAAAPAAAVPAAVDTQWQTPTVSLAWDGSAVMTADESFVGVPVTVPGDRAVRTLRVRNDGPAAGTLRAWVQQVETAPAAVEDAFYDDLRLDWSTASGTGAASFRDLATAQRTQVAQVPLAVGESTVITVGYTFPVEATTGNRAEVGAREASFVVHLEIGGDLPGPTPGTPPSATPGAPSGSAVRPLAMTGADLARTALVALGAVATGGLLVAAVRRRRRSDGASGGRGPA
ncbi:hypothetical protein J1G44_00980 [Cellulomonas sp. zg-ZUI199]|uniref:Gram-positive cocci surface proteins LPxTG domain-containing protein n=1 Tax=Cellulomonas wangleii TaxID=2816956 RepID=A0ABX8D316_9CELL|nr:MULTISPECIES: hypothetical protein [Cellulomonas]MBO0899663.1 hypothetical protein [Cellulomonas sp. zg-ZUI22]MBO0923057.1 hypothetical protein [Cellulomonas wangleii]QVI61441.1 hypothetical protein KG103_13265 [Cellulomonas wangleii]